MRAKTAKNVCELNFSIINFPSKSLKNFSCMWPTTNAVIDKTVMPIMVSNKSEVSLGVGVVSCDFNEIFDWTLTLKSFNLNI